MELDQTPIEDGARMKAHTFAQISALIKKNLLLMKRSWFWTLIRALILPVAFIVFMVSAWYSRQRSEGHQLTTFILGRS